MDAFLNGNILLDVIGVVIVCIIAFTGPKYDKSTYSRLFFPMIALIITILLTDSLAWSLNGSELPSARWMLWVFNTVYYAAQVVFCYFWLLFAGYWGLRDSRKMRVAAIPVAIPAVIELALVLINPWTGWVFTIDAANSYVRGSLFDANLVLYVFYIAGAALVSLYACVHAEDEMAKRRSQLLLLFMALPVIAAVIQFLHFGTSILWPCTALLLMMIHLSRQQQVMADERLKLASVEQELIQGRVSTMMSQIQPHFLFNTLNAIYYLCGEEPKTAQRAVGDFATYLRATLDSVNRTTPVAFEKELEHTRIYLQLEKMRFDDELTVDYDIRATAFALPALTVQPLVENAVKHGLGQKKGGGRVGISSREKPECFEVVIKDDGVGYDALDTGALSETGIQNVRWRLADMVNGSLEIESVAGEGTTAVIRVPKEGVK